MSPKAARGGARQRALRAAAAEGNELGKARSRSPKRTSTKGDGGRGGAKQRAMRSSAASSNEAPGVGEGRLDTKEFREHVAKLFLKNKFSGAGAMKLFQTAVKSGAHGVDDLASCRVAKNAVRDILNKLARTSTMPIMYWF